MKKDYNSKESAEVTEKMRELVLAKIDAQIPSNLRLFIGNLAQNMNKEEIMNHVRNDDEIGKQIVAIHIKFMKAVANGHLIKAINSV